MKMMFKGGFWFLGFVSVVCGQFEHKIFPSLPIVPLGNQNALCERHTSEYLENLKNFTLWAYEMRDSSAKSTQSVLRGNIYNVGDFSQCLTSKAPFPTQFCLAIIRANIPHPRTPRNPFSLYFDGDDYFLIDKLYRYEDISKQSRNMVKLGWCFPASCTSDSAEKYLNHYFHSMDYSLKEENVTYTAEVPKILCMSSNDQNEMDGYDIAFCMLAMILVIFVVVATCWEYNQSCDKTLPRSPLRQLISVFSARKNFEDLNKLESHNDALSSLYGMKTFAICMVILGHRFGIFVAGPVSNFDYIEQMYRNVFASCIFHGDLFVDTFFVVSGLLVVYNILNVLDKKYVNPAFVIFMRYMRLTPAYAFVIFFGATIFYHTGNGVLWKAVIASEVRDCRDNWWTNLLYISNYVYEKNMCMPHSWYLPCDFHYFILAVGLCFLIKNKKLHGLVLLSTLTITSIIIPFIIIFIYERPAFMKFDIEFLEVTKRHTDYLLIYIKSHARATPYFVGMFAGYTYHRLKNSGRLLSKWYTAALVTISVFLLMVCMYSGVVFYDPYHPYNALESAIYGSLHRALWALGTFGMMFSLSHGTMGFLRKFLSAPIWVPLSKLVYGAYLWHLFFQYRTLGMTNGTRVFSFFDVVMCGLADICLSFILALALYLTVEAPIKGILKELFSPFKTDKKKNNAIDESAVQREESKL